MAPAGDGNADRTSSAAKAQATDDEMRFIAFPPSMGRIPSYPGHVAGPASPASGAMSNWNRASFPNSADRAAGRESQMNADGLTRRSASASVAMWLPPIVQGRGETIENP